LNAAVDRLFTALADPHRRRAVELLGEQPRPAGELARALGLPAPTLSRHLRLMKACGLVEERHPEFDARVRVYALKDGAMTELSIGSPVRKRCGRHSWQPSTPRSRSATDDCRGNGLGQARQCA